MKKLSWEQAEKVIEDLSNKIKASGFVPDYIIGVTTGGLIPLYFLAKKLDDINNILTISATSYDKDRKKDLRIIYLPKVDLSGKNVLLVDEIVETGDTLKKISEIIVNQYKVGELKTATLGANTDKCRFYPDFYVIEEKGEWVVFPWENDDFPEYFKKDSSDQDGSKVNQN